MQPRRREDAKKATGWAVSALLAVLAAVSLAEFRAVSAADAVRDLATAPAESVGVSTARLRRIDEAMKRTVDEKRIAGTRGRPDVRNRQLVVKTTYLWSR